MSSTPAVRIRDLGKRFRVQRGWKELVLRPRERDTRTALEAVDLDVAQGEFFGVLGENGAGKTTLFKILATLVLPDTGSAEVEGIDVVEDPAGVRDVLVPVIPAERSLFWRLSAEENLRLYASLYGLAGAKARVRIGEALDIVGLSDAGRKQVGLFSSGMKQRLLIGRALLGRPRVLLLDEPTRSLDPVSARAFRTFLKRNIGEEQGTTVLLATHDHEEVSELCDRVAVLDQGRLLAVGNTEQLLASSRVRQASIWTPDATHSGLREALDRAGARIVDVEGVPLSDGTEWSRVRIQLEADETEAADLLAALAKASVPVSRYTRDDLSLADLIERVKAGGHGRRSEGREV